MEKCLNCSADSTVNFVMNADRRFWNRVIAPSNIWYVNSSDQPFFWRIILPRTCGHCLPNQENFRSILLKAEENGVQVRSEIQIVIPHKAPILLNIHLPGERWRQDDPAPGRGDAIL